MNSTPDFEHRRWLHHVFRELAAHEDELINHRLTIFLALSTAQAVVVAALLQFPPHSDGIVWAATLLVVLSGIFVSDSSYRYLSRTCAAQWLYRAAAKRVETVGLASSTDVDLNKLKLDNSRGPLKQLLPGFQDLTGPLNLHQSVLSDAVGNPLPYRLNLAPTDAVPSIPLLALSAWVVGLFLWGASLVVTLFSLAGDLSTLSLVAGAILGVGVGYATHQSVKSDLQ